MGNTIVGLFDSENSAILAIQAMLDAGVSQGAIQAISNEPDQPLGGAEEGANRTAASALEAFFGELRSVGEDETHGVTEDHLRVYGDSVRSGKTLLMVVADKDDSPRIIDIFLRHGALDIDETPELRRKAGSAYEAHPGGVRVFPRKPRSREADVRERQVFVAPASIANTGSVATASTVQVVETDTGPVREESPRVVQSGLEPNPDQLTFSWFEADFRDHYETTLSGTGYPWDFYVPAYRYGFNLGAAPGWPAEWEQIEPYAKDQWERHNPFTWERFVDAVCYAWQRVRAASRSIPGHVSVADSRIEARTGH